jgi:Ala-tRNA(Pro) deacylase
VEDAMPCKTRHVFVSCGRGVDSMAKTGPTTNRLLPEIACLGHLEEYLGNAGVAYEVSRHPMRYTAQELAQVEHVAGKLVAKVVMIVADEKLIMVVIPATGSVDLSRVKEAIGARDVHLANELEFGHVFPDCAVGAMPPFGNLYGVPVFVDVALTSDPVIMFNAGSHDTMMTMTYATFAQLVQPKTGMFLNRRPAVRRAARMS